MTGRFTVLASGSSGNAALLETEGFGLLIDCGLQPRMLTARLREAGASWEKVNAVILTHIHGDHWKDRTLGVLRSDKIPLYAHAEHHDYLSSAAPAYEALHRAQLTRDYAAGTALELVPGLTARPIAVSHDAEPTFAFRFDRSDTRGPAWSIGYASDLGCGSSELIEAFAGVNVLALEFNHDVRMECRSRRPRVLIDRVLGDCGHLSNEQAGSLAAAIVERSGASRPEHLIQLHLSRECNRPELAAKAGREALARLCPTIELTTARQDAAARSVALARRSGHNREPGVTGLISNLLQRSGVSQPVLPGFE
jgi:phosphoribosyl 1,2-cyclic phosphodiesterase